MRILHISDLHIGHHNPHLLANLKTRAPVLKPNLILVTGDLAHHCDEESLAGARDYLQELAQLCSQSPNGVDPQLGSRSPSGAKQPETNQPKLLVIPGNHDCSLWGWVPVSATQREFRKVFGELPSSHFFPAEQVWIYGFNSATHGWSVRSNGKILGDDLKEFVAVATQLRKEHGTKFDYAYKIVALHHHPVPIGYDDKHARWLTLLNAAEFLEEMIKLDVDLIVHGHEHVHAQATFGRGLLKDDDKQLTIVSVGSLSHLKPGKDNNRFNLIHIEPHGEVYVDSYEGKGATFTTEYSDRFTACTRHQAEERKFKQAVADIGYAYERIELYSQLNMDGDAFRIVNCKGLHLHQSSQPILGRRIALPRTSGYIDLPQVFELDEQSQRRGDLLFEKRVDAETRARPPKGLELVVDYDCTLHPGVRFSMGYEWWAVNAMAMSRMQCAYKYSDRRAYEYIHFPVTDPIRDLVWLVKFPDEFTLKQPEPYVCKIQDSPSRPRRDVRLSQGLAAGMHFDAKNRLVFLQVHRPQIGYSYGIRWFVLDDIPPSTSELVGLTDHLVDRLVSFALAPSTEAKAGMGNLLGSAAQLILNYLAPDSPHELEVGIMVFDQHQRLMLTAGAITLKESRLNWVDRVHAVFEYGEGLGGKAFKSNDVRLYSYRREPSGSTPNYYIDPEAGTPYKFLLSIPLRAPNMPHNCYAVLNCGSPHKGSPLGELNVKFEDIEDVLRTLNRTCYEELSRIFQS